MSHYFIQRLDKLCLGEDQESRIIAALIEKYDRIMLKRYMKKRIMPRLLKDDISIIKSSEIIKSAKIPKLPYFITKTEAILDHKKIKSILKYRFEENNRTTLALSKIK